MDKLTRQIGQIIYKLRLEREWLQRELAIKAHLPVRTIGRIERGEVNVRVATLAKIARALDVPVKDLFP
jgi:XRE family transcriptional regulator, regulator of sulfur utilization